MAWYAVDRGLEEGWEGGNREFRDLVVLAQGIEESVLEFR